MIDIIKTFWKYQENMLQLFHFHLVLHTSHTMEASLSGILL